jgi:hypothetical protein
MIRFAKLFVSVAAFLLAAAVSMAGTVTGTIRNGTTGKPAAGVQVILIQLQGGMQPVDNTKTDAEGHFQFTNPGIGGQMPMLIRAVYRDVFYHEPLPPGHNTVDIAVYEPTQSPSAISVTAHAIILQPNGPDLTVGEEYSIDNKTQPPLTYYRSDGSFLFTIPEGAQLSDVSAAGASGMPVIQSTMDKGKGVQAIAFAFRPGESEIRITYKLPYAGDHAQFKVASRYPISRQALFAAPSVQVSAGGFSPAGQEQGLNAYMREDVAANKPVEISVSGTAPPPPADNSAAAGPADAGNSQNPSVNSRADDSSGDSATATATALPARLDSLKWILVAGFAAIFVLGFFFLLRRPQEVVAAGPGAAAVAVAAPSAPVPAKREAAPRAASSSPPPSAPQAEAPRGSMDEIKDTLFRIELRRQAGTISEDEYARERQRIEHFLRSLVRG